MKMKKIFLSVIILSLFILVGCKKKEPVLLGPKKVSFVSPGNILTWTKEDEAVSYVILINDVEVPVTTNSYDMNSYAPGLYKVRVRSIFKDKESNYSPELTIQILGERLIIYIKDYKIYVTSIKNASYKYSLRVDHNKVEGTVSNGIIDIPTEFYDRIIHFDLDVYVGEELISSANAEISLILNNAFKNKDLEILVNNPIAVYIDGEKIAATLLPTKAVIPKETLATLGSEVVLSVSGDMYVIKKLYITNPFVELTSPQVINESDTLKFTFELNGFQFTEIAKEEFKLGVDYFFNEGVLTFSDTFISKYKDLFPESKSVYLMAVFRRGTETVLINVTITLGA